MFVHVLLLPLRKPGILLRYWVLWAFHKFLDSLEMIFKWKGSNVVDRTVELLHIVNEYVTSCVDCTLQMKLLVCGLNL